MTRAHLARLLAAASGYRRMRLLRPEVLSRICDEMRAACRCQIMEGLAPDIEIQRPIESWCMSRVERHGEIVLHLTGRVAHPVPLRSEVERRVQLVQVSGGGACGGACGGAWIVRSV